MKQKRKSILSVIMATILTLSITASIMPSAFASGSGKGVANTGVYQNLFLSIGKTESQVQAKLNAVFQQLFYGTDGADIINDGKRIYYPVGSDMAYIYDTGNNDVRSEGMSYGMMIAVQMNKKTEFDRLWKWAKTYMYHSSGERKGTFSWQCTTSGNKKDPNCAPDGEEYFATALLFASARWGDGEGIFNYRKEALNILSYMLHVNDRPGYDLNTAIDPEHKLVVFTPYGSAATFTDPSYHLPAFYEVFARETTDREDKLTWFEVANNSRAYFKLCTHPTTGLSPEYAEFTGEGCGGHQDYAYDAWRVPMNVAMDYYWWQQDSWQVTYANRIQNFFYSQGIGQYLDNYTLDGRAKYGADHSIGAVGCNAVASLISTQQNKWSFVQELWDSPIPEGKWRYYNGTLYLLSLLNVSGNYKVYLSKNATTEIPPEPSEETIPNGKWIKILDHTNQTSAKASLYTPYNASSGVSYNQYGPDSTECLQITGGGSSSPSGIKLDISNLVNNGDYVKAVFKVRVTGVPETTQAFLTDGSNRSVMKYADGDIIPKDQWITYNTKVAKVVSENGKSYFCVTNASGYWFIKDVVLYKLEVDSDAETESEKDSETQSEKDSETQSEKDSETQSEKDSEPQAKEYFVIFDDNGHGTAPDILTVKEGQTVIEALGEDGELPWIQPVGDFVMEGWYKDKVCTKSFDLEKDKVNEDLILYAKWIEITTPEEKVTVKFDLNGYGKGIILDQVVVLGSTVPKPVSPTDETMTFDGWYTDTQFTQKFDFSTPLIEDTVLYAKWVETKTVTYTKGDANLDGTVDIIDVALIRAHIVAMSSLSGDNLTVSDCNDDGNVDIIDVVMIRSHIVSGTELNTITL